MQSLQEKLDEVYQLWNNQKSTVWALEAEVKKLKEALAEATRRADKFERIALKLIN